MNRFSVLYKKELNQILFSFTSFFSLIIFPIFISVWFFFVLQFFSGRMGADLSGFFGIIPSLFILIIPSLTTKSWADEKKYRTSELLLTMPFSERVIVLAKFGAVLTVVVIMLLLSMFVPLTLLPLGNFDAGVIISSFVGLFFYASAAASICLLVTCFVSGAFISWLLSAAILLILSGVAIGGSSIFSLLIFSSHMESFGSGLLSIDDMAYFLFLILFPLFLSGKIILIRRWS